MKFIEKPEFKAYFLTRVIEGASGTSSDIQDYWHTENQRKQEAHAVGR